MAQDTIADAYLRDGVSGRTSPSDATAKRQAEMQRWRTLGSQLFACGDYLHAEHAMRNSLLASQGVFGPVVAPRQLQAGERVLFQVEPQAERFGAKPRTRAREIWSLRAALLVVKVGGKYQAFDHGLASKSSAR